MQKRLIGFAHEPVGEITHVRPATQVLAVKKYMAA